MLTQGFQEFYGSITKAPEAIFQQKEGGALRLTHLGELGCFQLKQGVTTYPSARGWRMIRGMRVPWKEYARSRHQRLFEENIGKTGKDVIYEF